MIMPSGQQLLLPASPLFIWSSLVAALLLNMLPLGRVPWMPDFLALVLVFWSVHQPLRVGIGIAFMFGLAMDVHQTSLLGQHAFSYVALSFFTSMIQPGKMPPPSSRSTSSTACAAANSGSTCKACSGTLNHSSRR